MKKLMKSVVYETHKQCSSWEKKKIWNANVHKRTLYMLFWFIPNIMGSNPISSIIIFLENQLQNLLSLNKEPEFKSCLHQK